jgi:hypothetical protein
VFSSRTVATLSTSEEAASCINLSLMGISNLATADCQAWIACRSAQWETCRIIYYSITLRSLAGQLRSIVRGSLLVKIHPAESPPGGPKETSEGSGLSKGLLLPALQLAEPPER